MINYVKENVMSTIAKAVRAASNKIRGVTSAERGGMSAQEEAKLLDDLAPAMRAKQIKADIYSNARDTGAGLPKVTEAEVRASGASLPARTATTGNRTIPRPSSSFKSGGQVKSRGNGCAKRGLTRAKTR